MNCLDCQIDLTSISPRCGYVCCNCFNRMYMRRKWAYYGTNICRAGCGITLTGAKYVCTACFNDACLTDFGIIPWPVSNQTPAPPTVTPNAGVVGTFHKYVTQPFAPKFTKARPMCTKCKIELSPELDAYYGKIKELENCCSKCQSAFMRAHSAAVRARA